MSRYMFIFLTVLQDRLSSSGHKHPSAPIDPRALRFSGPVQKPEV